MNRRGALFACYTGSRPPGNLLGLFIRISTYRRRKSISTTESVNVDRVQTAADWWLLQNISLSLAPPIRSDTIHFEQTDTQKRRPVAMATLRSSWQANANKFEKETPVRR